VAKPTSHSYLQQWIQAYPKEERSIVKATETKGAQKHVYAYQIYKNVPLTADINSPIVNYFEIEVSNSKNKIIYKNSFVTNHIPHSDEFKGPPDLWSLYL
jgi:hypothetical protein